MSKSSSVNLYVPQLLNSQKMQVLTNADRQKSVKSPPTKRTKPLIYILKANSSTTYRLRQEHTYQVSQNDLHIKNISAN